MRVAVDDTTNIIIIPERKHSDPNEMRFSSGFPSLSLSFNFVFYLFCSIFISKMKREKAVTVMRFVRLSYVAGCWAGFFHWLADWLLTFLLHCMRFVLCTHISTNFRAVFVRATSWSKERERERTSDRFDWNFHSIVMYPMIHIISPQHTTRWISLSLCSEYT